MTRGADLVVVDDLQSVRTATKREVYLHGGAIANVDYIKSTGAGGACISFKAAVRSRPLHVCVCVCVSGVCSPLPRRASDS